MATCLAAGQIEAQRNPLAVPGIGTGKWPETAEDQSLDDEMQTWMDGVGGVARRRLLNLCQEHFVVARQRLCEPFFDNRAM